MSSSTASPIRAVQYVAVPLYGQYVCVALSRQQVHAHEAGVDVEPGLQRGLVDGQGVRRVDQCGAGGLDPEPPPSTQGVDAVVGVARVSEDLLVLLEPGVHGVPGHGDIAGGVTVGECRHTVDVTRWEGVGRRAPRSVHEQGALAVDHGDAVLHATDASAVGLHVGDGSGHRRRETSRRPRAQGTPSGREAHSAVRSSTVPVPAGKGRTIASTVKEASRSPPRSCTRHSEWVMPFPAKVERWW